MPSMSWKQARMMARIVVEPEYAEERKINPQVAKDFNDEDREAGIFFDERGILIPEEESAAANVRAKEYNRLRRERLDREAAENGERGEAEASRGSLRTPGDPQQAEGGSQYPPDSYTNEDPY